MIRSLLHISALCLFIILSGAALSYAAAQDEPADLSAMSKQELAERYYDLNPAWMIVSAQIRAKAQDFPKRQQLIYITALERMVDKEKIREESIPLIVELFSQEELVRLISFYEDPVIQSSFAKQETFARKITPFMSQRLDEAILRLKTDPDAQKTP